MESFKPLIAKVAAGAQLTRAEAAAAFESMLSGDATPAQVGGFLMALRVRGEAVEEITGAVTTMRAKMLRVAAPDGAIDIVGTGGDGSGSYNISTLAALIVAACGVPVAAFPVTGPIDVVQDGVTGALDTDLARAAQRALRIDPRACRERALRSSWDTCTHEFESNLVACRLTAGARTQPQRSVTESQPT